MNKYLILLLSITLFGVGCTPKTTAVVEKPKEETKPVVKPKNEEELSHCRKFSDAANPDQAETNYVLYRSFLKEGHWDKSYELWQKVYKDAPAADGRRSSVYLDGVQFYEHFLETEEDSVQRNIYIEKIFQLYDEIIECYPKERGEVLGYKAFDLFYTYENRISNEELFELYKEVIELEGNKTPDFILTAFTSLLIDYYEAKKVSLEEAQYYDKKLRSILSYGLAHCEENDDCIDWKTTEEYTLTLLTYFETVKGFYDCDYFMKKYYPAFEEGEKNCETAIDIYSHLKFAECDEKMPEFAKVIAYATENCSEKGTAQLAYEALKNGKYREAIKLFKQAAGEDQYKDRRGKLFLIVAKIYYAHLRNFPKAREYALKAAAAQPHWGEPFILIGQLYASSGPLCGPGRGWDSQIVVWPAIDKWKHAKAIDPSSAKEANRWINRYAQFMPSKEDIFQRTLKNGDSFYVGCWIKEKTTIRPAR